MRGNVPVAQATRDEAVLPERVQEALGELVGAAKEGLLALSVGVGLGVLSELMEEELDDVVGPKGKHNQERTAVRHGHEDGEVTLGGRRVEVRRPRVRTADGEAEVGLLTYEHFADRDPPAGVSTRRYRRTQEPVGEQVETRARSTSKSAVSRTFMERTRETLVELMGRELGDLRLAVMMLDGLELKGRMMIVALGITTEAGRVALRARPTAVLPGELGPQAMEYESWDDLTHRVRQFFNEIGQSHTYAVRCVSEVMMWVQGAEYDRIVRGEYRTRDQETDVREEPDAMEFYAERFRTIFREAGDNITKLGSQMGGMAEQVWVRKRGGGSGGEEGRGRRNDLAAYQSSALDLCDHDGYRFSVFLTDQAKDSTPKLDLTHRDHARVEDRIRESKD
ncbi:MAG: hypothetical protein ACR2LV_09495, partial [Solirubrobacteraceae bacterium]